MIVSDRLSELGRDGEGMNENMGIAIVIRRVARKEVSNGRSRTMPR
jgi:hypothetical protein